MMKTRERKDVRKKDAQAFDLATKKLLTPKEISREMNESPPRTRERLRRELDRLEPETTKQPLRERLRKYQEDYFPCHTCRTRKCENVEESPRGCDKVEKVETYLHIVEPPQSQGNGMVPLYGDVLCLKDRVAITGREYLLGRGGRRVPPLRVLDCDDEHRLEAV